MFIVLIEKSKELLPIVGILSLSGAAVTFLWGVVIFLLNRSREMHEAEFNRFHEIIRKLQHDLDADGKTTSPYIEIQIAAVYELRYLKRYHSVSLIYLKSKKTEWTGLGGLYLNMGVPVIDHTINCIER
ncbi:hypothetical protein V1954_14970 [Yersinia sp. 2538 StPb PI]|uniref:hypothetical protein n=1 Tax=Yersinia sp. 2538 StPb PI TaxID=3117405 RepID=UPI003B916374